MDYFDRVLQHDLEGPILIYVAHAINNIAPLYLSDGLAQRRYAG